MSGIGGEWKETVRREIDEQIALVTRLRMILSKAADDVAARLAVVDNPLAKVEAMTRLADIMTRVARTAADMRRLVADQTGPEPSIEELLKEDIGT